MGYKRKLYHLTWPEDHDLHGLEVTTSGLSVERMFRMATLAQGLGNGETEQQVRVATELFGEFAKCLVSWNLEEDDGTPVPATSEAVAAQDMGFMIGLVMTWMDAVAGVDIPLPEPSPNGETAPEESLLLATSSKSLGS